MKRGYILFCVFLLTLSSVFASELSVTYEPERAYVFPGEDAVFTLGIHNDAYTGGIVTVQIKSLDLNWILQEDFDRMDIPPRGVETLVVHYAPLEDLAPGDYGVQFTAVTDFGREKMFLPVRVLDPAQTIRTDFYTEEPVDPRQGSILKVILENTAGREFPDLDVRLASEFFELDSNVALGPFERVVLEFPVHLPGRALEGTYPVAVTLFSDGELLGTSEDILDVSKYGDLTQVVVDGSDFLRTSTSITQTNEGNAEYHAPLVREFSLLEKTFTRFAPAPRSIEKRDGYYEVVWDVTLAPGEVLTVTYVTSYRMPVAVLLILLLIGFGWYYFTRRVITITKKVASVQPRKGQLSTLKVTLVIRNTSSRPLVPVKVLDTVPNTTVAPQTYGTLKPLVKKGVQSVHLLWEIPQLKAGEERVITYEVKSALHFSGSLLLPCAVARYRDGERREMSTSNTCVIREK